MEASILVWNLCRVGVIIFGGMVVGGGTVVLLERARFYARHDIPEAVRAMRMLIVVNALVMTYITSILLAHWDAVITWRAPLAMLVFVCKAAFFWQLRQTGLEQERRALYAGVRA